MENTEMLGPWIFNALNDKRRLPFRGKLMSMAEILGDFASRAVECRDKNLLSKETLIDSLANNEIDRMIIKCLVDSVYSWSSLTPDMAGEFFTDFYRKNYPPR